MKDFVGNELAIGDKVVSTNYERTGLYKGKVVSISKTRVTVEYKTDYGTVRKTNKTPQYVVKV